MTPKDHEDYARDLLFSLRGDSSETGAIDFDLDPRQKGNAAQAMAAILCDRLLKNSEQDPIHKRDAAYEWKQGIFNCRNIADRGYAWTNITPGVRKTMHDAAKGQPVAYLLARWRPSGRTMNIWAIPEPLMHDTLPRLPIKKSGKGYNVQIYPDKQCFHGCEASPDLSPYCESFQLDQYEKQLLDKSHELDNLVKRESKNARAEEETDYDDGDDDDAVPADTKTFLATAEQQLDEAGAFNPEGIADTREHDLSSIVRRRGQPAFRKDLLSAYNGRCAITGCEVAAVLEAAHIVSYRGPVTNHPANGLLLRTDLHTLFDLRMVAVDVDTMTLLVSPELSGTNYEEYRGKPITVPDNRKSRPSRKALRQHRQESGL